MARNLFKLGTILYKKDYLATSEAMLNNMKKIIESSQNPNFLSNWCQLYIDMQNPPYEVAILGPDYENFRNKLMKVYQPNAIYIGGELEGTLELLKDKLLEGETTIYVCQNKVCKLPVHRVDDALKLLID